VDALRESRLKDVEVDQEAVAPALAVNAQLLGDPGSRPHDCVPAAFIGPFRMRLVGEAHADSQNDACVPTLSVELLRKRTDLLVAQSHWMPNTESGSPPHGQGARFPQSRIRCRRDVQAPAPSTRLRWQWNQRAG